MASSLICKMRRLDGRSSVPMQYYWQPGPSELLPLPEFRVALQSGLGGDELFPGSAPGRPCVAVTSASPRPPWLVTQVATPPRLRHRPGSLSRERRRTRGSHPLPSRGFSPPRWRPRPDPLQGDGPGPERGLVCLGALSWAVSAPGARRVRVNVGDTVAMLPKSRRALTIQEIAALARSSLHGISQVVKDHVTKPTAMAQGRVAHLIEWKGWSKPSDSPAALESAFSSYSDLSEGEQEARFAAGVAEQFAIAEAKLRAWSSVDGEDSTDESYDEDFAGGTDSDMAGQLPLGPHLQDLFTGHRFSRPLRQGSVEPESDCSQTVSPETLCSSLCSLEDGLLGSPARLASQLLGEELLLAKLPPSRESAFRSLGPLEAQDSLYNSPLTESCLSPAEEEPAPCKDCQSLCLPPVGSWERQRQASDVASSGVVSLDEDEAEPEEQ
uniref:Family with sequence similarity 131 member A n=2 Tax=Equus asinus TaxID=9793 RepID=A0A9L0IP72_EQUAS|nr:protein FAM131A isoform X1 [Equus asinus]